MDYRHMMQENLDGDLHPEQAESLWEHLAQDEEAADENAQLEGVHHVLSRAPHVRAPQRLAATIMARLAKTLESQAKLQDLPQETKLALLMSMSIVQVAMMPSLLAASYMVVNYQHDPAILSHVVQRTIGLQVMMIDALIVLLDEIERMIEKDPETAPVAMALIPVALKGILEYIQSETDHIQNGAA